MNRTGKLFLIALAVLPLASACRKKPVNAPTPKAVADSIARERARLDSITRADAENARTAAERTREENMRAQQQSTRSVQTTMAAPIYFELDDADLTPEAIGVLEAKVAILQRDRNMRIRITGHTDEQGSDEYNIALGMRRASETKRFLVDRGVAENRIEVATRGEEEPAVSGHDETAWSRNRRAEFIILSR
jgi:peptidoglycan-associated lipoprotein